MTTQQPTAQSTAPNSKRPAKMASSQSLNHLLNFSLPPRQTHQYQNAPRRRKPGQHQAVLNKERFVNAQYRFVMNPGGDYTVHFADPDIYFQWHDILQIIIPRTSAVSSATGASVHTTQEEGVTTCPICLSPPTAPRMTKCGHVFCFPCLLHYLNTSDTLKWVRCPICFDSVNERQLKAVKWIDPSAMVEEEEDDTPPRASSSSASVEGRVESMPSPGMTLRMRLMQRPQITTLALPRSSTWPSDLLPPHQAPFHFLPDVDLFAKFMLATPSALIGDLTRDLDDLATERRMLSGMQDSLGVSFIDVADVKVRQQMVKAAALETAQLKDAIEAAHHALEQLEQRSTFHSRKTQEDQARTTAPLEDAPTDFLSLQPSAFQAPTPASQTLPVETQRVSTATRNSRQRRNLNPPPPSTSAYYYYQAASGMPIFLHPLDIKILLSHFNGYSAFPDTITVRVESHTESTVNDDLRKRCKYLSHFPEGADVVFVETDLESVVGQDGLKNFERALAMRRARRKDKDRKDDKARAKAEEREKERIVHNWNEITRHTVDAHILLPAPRAPSPPLEDLSDFPEPGRERVLPPPPAAMAQQSQATGAWGARSFASAAQHSSSGNGRGAVPAPVHRPARRPTSVGNDDDEWDLDVAFHELEQRSNRSSGGGGKRKNNRLVVLGGGGGRRR
ncbi:hypothetical protein BC835DRAFT_1374119 [Cytidiella melzeri]|nr:hypothetical protein BC835DRAFT_1374119 [Cytidiella melzeri]